MRAMLVPLLLVTLNMTAQIPTMDQWTRVWREADPKIFMELYSEDAIVFPGHKSVIIGNKEILEFMRGGLGKVDVIFHPEMTFLGSEVRFEYGMFYDEDLKSGKQLGRGRYAVTWILTPEGWKLLSHSWTPTEKIGLHK